MLPTNTLHGILLAHGRTDLIAAIQQRQSRGLVVGHDGSVRQMTVAEQREWQDMMAHKESSPPTDPSLC